jgi:hypothetical protein
MERFEIQPVSGSALPDVATFLCRWRSSPEAGSSAHRPPREDAAILERRLRWLLLENPLATDSSCGFCVRDQAGIIRGITLCFSCAFRASSQRILGLCSGSFLVEPEARTLGFYLFKRYLQSPGYSFYFATTCNANSAPLWIEMGGCAIPNSETEYVLPLNFETLLPAVVTGRTSCKLASGIARILGRCANPLLRRVEPRPAEFAVEPCRDWEKLSELFLRHRSTAWITADRSPGFLQWRYGNNAPPSTVSLFRDKRGNEGWFSLGNAIRGRRGQIRGSLLLDAIWPREKMSFSDVLPAILQVAGAQSDALFLPPRPGLDYRECGRWVIPRKLESPQAFAISQEDPPRLTVGSLDLVFADGDSALPI